MAMASLLAFSATPLTFSHKTHLPSTLYSLKPSSFLTFTKPRKLIISAQSNNNNNNSADTPDRIISAICYFYPFFDGIHYGKYVITQFTPLQVLLQPLVPAIRVFNSFPFNGFLVFLTLYFIVVRNPNFSRYVRFNTMQAIVLDVLLIFPDLLERSFHPTEGLGLDLVMSLDSTVFLFLLVCLIYGSGSCFLGQVPRLPIVAEAAERASPEAMSSTGTRSNQDDGYHCSNLQPEPGSSTGSRQCKLMELSVSCDPGIKNWNMAVKQAPCGAIPVKQKQ